MSDPTGPLPMAWVPPGVEVQNPEHWPLARAAVKHGQGTSPKGGVPA